MHNSQEVADVIRDVLQCKHDSALNMLSKLGLSDGTLQNMKTSMPKSDNLAKIAQYLNVSMDYLMGLTDKAHESIYKDLRDMDIISLSQVKDFLYKLEAEQTGNVSPVNDSLYIWVKKFSKLSKDKQAIIEDMINQCDIL